LPAALKALLAQLCGGLVAFVLLAAGLLPAVPWAAVGVQAVAAALAAIALGSDRWWIPIHLGFAPLLLAARTLPIAPGWYLAAFLVLLAIYWTSFHTRVPLYLSNQRTVDAVAALVPADRPMRVLDLGCGTGSLLLPLARLRPHCRVSGIEAAPAPFLLCRLRSRGLPNIELARGDFFAHSWSEYDRIYAFLSPVPMDAVWHKFEQEARPGATLISNSFPVSGRKPDQVIEVGDRRGTRLYLYHRPVGHKGARKKDKRGN